MKFPGKTPCFPLYRESLIKETDTICCAECMGSDGEKITDVPSLGVCVREIFEFICLNGLLGIE